MGAVVIRSLAVSRVGPSLLSGSSFVFVAASDDIRRSDLYNIGVVRKSYYVFRASRGISAPTYDPGLRTSDPQCIARNVYAPAGGAALAALTLQKCSVTVFAALA